MEYWTYITYLMPYVQGLLQDKAEPVRFNFSHYFNLIVILIVEEG